MDARSLAYDVEDVYVEVEMWASSTNGLEALSKLRFRLAVGMREVGSFTYLKGSAELIGSLKLPLSVSSRGRSCDAGS